jgi:hypothetical protein
MLSSIKTKSLVTERELAAASVKFESERLYAARRVCTWCDRECT